MTIERVYNIPLRKGFVDVAAYKKTKRAVRTLQEFLSKHMHQPDMNKVLIGKNLNLELWKHGIKNPPGQVKVVVVKEDNGDVKAELYGFKYEHKKKEQKEDKQESKIDEMMSKVSKKKSTSSETKHEHHEHSHDSPDAHTHEEKHEHTTAQTHEKPAVKKAPAKKAPAKKSE